MTITDTAAREALNEIESRLFGDDFAFTRSERETLSAFIDQSAAVVAERDALQASADLRWKADMRAIERWQTANPGNDLVWPDHADMCVWLMGQIDILRKAMERVVKAVGRDRGETCATGYDQFNAVCADVVPIIESIGMVCEEGEYAFMGDEFPDDRDALRSERDAAINDLTRLRAAMVKAINTGCDGYAADTVSVDFLCEAPAEFAAVKKQRDSARSSLEEAKAKLSEALGMLAYLFDDRGYARHGSEVVADRIVRLRRAAGQHDGGEHG